MPEKIQIPDDFGEGLEIQIKPLSQRRVKRATDAVDVIRVAMQHNLRIDNEDHQHRTLIDASRTHLNTVLFGAEHPDRVAELAQLEVARLGAAWPSRVDGVVGFELVLQPPPGGDVPEFWDECLSWVSQKFEHVLSGTVHRDQKHVHMHVIVLAIMDGRFSGRELQRGDYGAPRLRRAFFAHVREKLGLRNDRPDNPIKTGMDIRGLGHSSKKPMSIPINVQNCGLQEPVFETRTRLSRIDVLMQRILPPMRACPPPRGAHAAA